jgi:hypothetical protein
MIKGISAGPGLVVNGGNTSVPYVTINNNNPIQGMIRINGSDMQVFDGMNWMNLSTSYATVELNGETQSLLQWAREKRNKELEYERMARDNPAVQNAINVIKRAEEQLDLVYKLSKENYSENEFAEVQASP